MTATKTILPNVSKKDDNKVDGKKIKPDQWYTVENGKFILANVA